MNETTLWDSLGIDRFDCNETKSGLVQISYEGKTVATLSGQGAQRYLVKIGACDARGRQLLMAKATGHFKHGNERGYKP
ncbi:MAG: hypothetical protein ACJAVI_002863 [Candidatus Azotimanducaceae bacterium]|jgi:hypothetical protein